jgi:polyhydroxyalkanoate synthesis regulator protein
LEEDNTNKMAEILLEKNIKVYIKTLDETIKAHIQLTESYMKEYTICMEKVFMDHVKEIQAAMNKQSDLINDQQKSLNQLINKEINNA